MLALPFITVQGRLSGIWPYQNQDDGKLYDFALCKNYALSVSPVGDNTDIYCDFNIGFLKNALLQRSVTWDWMKMVCFYRSLRLRCIYFSFSHSADLILHCHLSARPVTAGLGAMLTFHKRAAAYKLVSLGVPEVLWSQWALANAWLNMWGLSMSVSLLKAASVCLSVPYGLALLMLTFAASSCSLPLTPLLGRDG